MQANGVPTEQEPLCEDRFLEFVTAALGEDAADRLFAVFGGLRLYIPQRPVVGSKLVDILGSREAQKITDEFGGTFVEVPVRLAAGRRRKVLELSLSGVSVQGIARAMGCTERHVYQMRAELRGAGLLPERRA